MNYQVCEPLSPEEFAALKADIAERGVMVPVEVDENGDTLDGHHRIMAWRELRSEGLDVPDYPVIIREGMSDVQKRNHARKLNALRRQMTKEQRDRLIVAMRQDGMSYRQIGDAVGVSRQTVKNIADDAGVKNLTPVTGADGKQYPATMPRRPQPAPVRYADVDDDGWGDPGLGVPVVEVDQGDEDEQEGAGAFATYACGLPALDLPHAPAGSRFVPAEPAAKPHVAHNSGNNEWYTPAEYIEAARVVMGWIDLDPASSELANTVVKAIAYYTAADDGLDHKWWGNVWLNPPYAGDLVGKFADKLIYSLEGRHIDQAIVLVNNATETVWFQTLISAADAVCFLRSRISYWSPEGVKRQPLQGQAVIYAGPHPDRFAGEFDAFGYILKPWS
ncbi:MAG: DNA N-6-adenine-methyltransferase [Caldilineaceae bacterium]